MARPANAAYQLGVEPFDAVARPNCHVRVRPMPRSSHKRVVAHRPPTAWRTAACPTPELPAKQPSPAEQPAHRTAPLRPEPGLPPWPATDPDEAMDGPDPRPLIDRRQTPRVSFAARAALAPADASGAVRPPAIRTRDLNPMGLGFTARQDLSVLGEAVLRLPGDAGRTVCVRCRVRRSRELGNGWYDGLVEFVVPQPLLTIEDGRAKLPPPPRRR